MPLAPQDAYRSLIEKWSRATLFGSIGSVLGWDMRTYMPAKGAAHRAEQLSLLSGLSHKMRTEPELADLLEAVEGTEVVANPDSVEAVNVREIRRTFDKSTKLPGRLVEELSKTASLGNQVWVDARKNNDFASFQPWLEKIINLVKEKADALGWKEHRYDALLDEYEPYATTAEIKAVFEPLHEELVRLAHRVASSTRKPDPRITENDFPVEAQAKLGRELTACIGFDFEAGRLDETTHPFCSGFGPGDTRLTTRYDPKRWTHSFYGTLHEAGHGLYNQGLEARHYGTPMGASVSLGIHESQSRMIENLVGRSKGFLQFFLPKFQAAFSGMADVSLEALHFAVNESKPSCIRVEADEATYNLHIMLRFDLEVALVEGSLQVADVPAAWNEKFKEYLWTEVPDNSQGCLQDIHWSGAGIGYFPTYALGNLYGAQFFAQAQKELGDLQKMFSKGEFQPLKEWLNARIHSQGKRFSSAQLCEKITGQKLSHHALFEHLKEKLVPLYGL